MNGDATATASDSAAAPSSSSPGKEEGMQDTSGDPPTAAKADKEGAADPLVRALHNH